jgi:alpha-galactosidase/6-phospho-beta-glucosidase family protein
MNDYADNVLHLYYQQANEPIARMRKQTMPIINLVGGIVANVPSEATVEIGAGSVDSVGVNPFTTTSILHAFCIISHFISGPVSVDAL